MSYEPKPIDTSGVNLDQRILELRERLAEHAHDVWARQRIKDGWRLGPKRDDARKEHPSLIPYAELSESEKQYDRNAALETLKAILALGYHIEGSGSASAAGFSPVDTTSDLERDLASLAGLGLRDLMEVWRGHDSWTWAHSPQVYVALAGQLLEAGAPLVAYDVVSEGLAVQQRDGRGNGANEAIAGISPGAQSRHPTSQPDTARALRGEASRRGDVGIAGEHA